MTYKDCVVPENGCVSLSYEVLQCRVTEHLQA